MDDSSEAFVALLISPFLALLGAVIVATILFWPFMLCLGALASYVPIIPALGWQACWFLIATVKLLF